MNMTEKTVKKNYVYRGKIVRVRCDDALLPNGKPCKREIVEHPGGAGVLYIKEGKVLLVRQFRYAFGKCLYEIPAGKLNYGEDPLLSAKRELSEEAGVEGVKMEPLCTYIPTCGYSQEKIYLYYASEGVATQSHPDEDEYLHVEYLPLEKVWDMICKGQIEDSKTIIAIQRYLLKMKE